MQKLKTLQIESKDTPDSAIIWLHGLGADGNDFVPIVEELDLPDNLAIRFIFPHAPVRPITVNQGGLMPGWYDVISQDVASTEDEAGIRETTDAILQLCMEQEALGIASHRIIIAGFSQGGAIALHCGLRYPNPLAGIMALSTYLPLQNSLQDEASEANKATDIFMAHGLHDNVISAQFGKQSYRFIRDAGYSIHYHGYDMEHSVCMEEITEIGDWITDCLKPVTSN